MAVSLRSSGARFREIDFFDDREPHSGSWNMAADEVLLGLQGMPRPFLRIYSWADPSVSMGYFESYSAVKSRYLPAYKPIRRWTGGGVVLHGDGADVTYSLIVSSESAEARMRARDFYAFVHGILCEVIREEGFSAAMIIEGREPGNRSPECFQSPVACDVIVEGRKVAGAGQKRTRDGLLHQGSIQGLDLPVDFRSRLAAGFAEVVRPVNDVLAGREGEIQTLAAEKYGSGPWLKRIP